MLKDSKTFSGFATTDLEATKNFYSQVLGLDVKKDEWGLTIKLADGRDIFVYEKADAQPANFTILNFRVEDIDAIVDGLVQKGVKFDPFDMGGGVKTDEKGVLRGLAAKMGPDIAWFKDPAGNVLAVLQES